MLILKSLNEKQMGSLMMFFLLRLYLAVFLLDLNPFDQPAVEEGKKLTKKLLKKENERY